MQCIVNNNNDTAIIAIDQPRFTYEHTRLFGEVCNCANEAGTGTVDVNLRGVNYIDSAALGMLLVLRDRCKRKQQTVRITGCDDSVSEVFKIANFQKLFPITKHAGYQKI